MLRSGVSSESTDLAKQLLILRSNGGVMSPAKAKDQPVSLVRSGPSGGIMASSAVGKLAGLGDMIKGWISTGPNPAISADQLQKALGSDAVTKLAAAAGITPFAVLNVWLLSDPDFPRLLWPLLLVFEAPWATAPLTVVLGGLMFGRANYLVGAEGESVEPRTWRLDRLRDIEVTDIPGSRPPGFTLQAFQERSFGIYQDEVEDIRLRMFSKADALDAYNDVSNLRLVSRSANSSHEWELMPDGHFRDTAVRVATHGRDVGG